MSTEKLAQDFVCHEGKRFFVSTINRESSAMGGDIYAETMAWEWAEGAEKRGALVGQDEAGRDSLAGHLRTVQRLRESGHLEPSHE